MPITKIDGDCLIVLKQRQFKLKFWYINAKGGMLRAPIFNTMLIYKPGIVAFTLIVHFKR